MATTNLGKVSVTPKGEYDPLITYERLDIISHNGSSYIVKQASTGVTPIEGEFYALIAEKGDGGSFVKKAYKTYVAMDADKVNIPADSSVDVTNDPDESKNGAYIYDGVAFTRSQYDSKVVTDKIIADTAIAVQDAINNTAVEGGVLADTFVTVTANDGYAATNLRSVVSAIRKTANYIVYAEKYGSTLNEAMDAINLEFAGKRVRIYVPSDFPVTNTVNLGVDCDLDMTSLQITNNLSTVFKPVSGWNGTASPCNIYLNNHSVECGWDLQSQWLGGGGLGDITIRGNAFYNSGNELLDTSAESFTAFYVSLYGIERLNLINPAAYDCWVKSNSIVGDVGGVVRGITCWGKYRASTGDIVSDINIYEPVFNGFKNTEDSDAISVQLSTTSDENAIINVDIHGGRAENVGKRFIKFILPKKAKGVRLTGDIYTTGVPEYAYAAIDLLGNGIVEASGSMVSKGFLYGLHCSQGGSFLGENFSIDNSTEELGIRGNSVFTVKYIGALESDNSTIALDHVKTYGGTGAIDQSNNCALYIKNLEATFFESLFATRGYTSIDKMTAIYVEPPPRLLPESNNSDSSNTHFARVYLGELYINDFTLKSDVVERNVVGSVFSPNTSKMFINKAYIGSKLVSQGFVTSLYNPLVVLRDIWCDVDLMIYRSRSGLTEKALLDGCYTKSTAKVYNMPWTPAADWTPPTGWIPPTTWKPPVAWAYDPLKWTPPEGWTGEDGTVTTLDSTYKLTQLNTVIFT